MPKLLVIEDDREINHLICEYMAEAGYEMLSASNGLEGLSMLERIKDIDLCLLDLMLPMKSGDRVIAGLRNFQKFRLSSCRRRIRSRRRSICSEWGQMII